MNFIFLSFFLSNTKFLIINRCIGWIYGYSNLSLLSIPYEEYNMQSYRLSSQHWQHFHCPHWFLRCLCLSQNERLYLQIVFEGGTDFRSQKWSEWQVVSENHRYSVHFILTIVGSFHSYKATAQNDNILIFG